MYLNLIVTHILYSTAQNLYHKEWYSYAVGVSNNHSDCNMCDICVVWVSKVPRSFGMCHFFVAM